MKIKKQRKREPEIKTFKMREIEEAIAFAAEDHTHLALHLHRIIVDRDKAPKCFVRAVDKGEDIAHLFCQSITKLVMTAKRFGVKVIVVERQGTPNQHIDLCGGPLAKAKWEAEQQKRKIER